MSRRYSIALGPKAARFKVIDKSKQVPSIRPRDHVQRLHAAMA